MRCLACGRKLPVRAPLRMRYCGAACRAWAFRARLRDVTAASSPAVTRQTVEGSHKGSDTGGPRLRKSSRKRPRAKAGKERRRAVSPAAAQPLRVPIDRQILRQAPPGAVGYRLALPGRTHAEKPKIIPGADATGAARFWSLHPFQLPDDLRLRDGHAYRILWVDAQGAAIPPQGTAQLPALRFFLGPADAESVEEDAAFADILRDVTDAKQRALIEAEVARDRLMLIRLRARTEDARCQVVIGEASVRNMKAQFEVTSEIARKTAEEAERRKAKEREERAKQEEERQRSDQQGLLITAGVTAVVGLITWLGYKAFGPKVLQARTEQAELAEQLSATTEDSEARNREAVPAAEAAATTATSTAASSPSSVTTAAPRMSAAMPATSPVTVAPAAANRTPGIAATTPGAPTAAQTPRSAPAVSGAPSATCIPALVGAASSGAVATTSTPPSGSTASSTALPTPPGFDTLTAEQQAAFRRLGTDLTFRYAFFAEALRACDPDLGSVLDTAEELSAPTAADQQQIRALLALEPCAKAIQEYRRMDAGASRASALAPSRLSAQADAGIAEGSDGVAVPVFQRSLSASTDGASADGESPLDALLGSQQPQGPCAGVAPTPGPQPEAQSHAPESVVADRTVAEIDTELHPTMDTSPEPETEPADAYDLSLDDAVGTLDESERRQLCDIVLDPEKMAQFNYEACCEEAIERDEPPPPELAIPLSDKERTTIQRARTDPRLSRALLALIIDFGNAQIDGADGMFKLTFPFKALKPEDIAWIRDAVATPARRTYYTYLRARHAALLEGNVPPPAPALSLPSKEQRIVRRAANDLRAVTYLESKTQAKPVAP